MAEASSARRVAQDMREALRVGARRARRLREYRPSGRTRRAGVLASISLLAIAAAVGLAGEPQRAASLTEPSRGPRIVLAPVQNLGQRDMRLPDPTSGEHLVVPSTNVDAEPDHPHDATALLQFYNVTSGDTLWTISHHFKLTLETLVWANGLSDPTALQIGQVLIIPPVDGLLYTVRADDTLESIAKAHKIDVQSIIDASGLTSAEIVEGEVLMLPGAEGPKLATPTPAPTRPKTYTKPKTGGGTGTVIVGGGTGGGTARWGASSSSNHFAYGYCTWGAAELFRSATGVYPGWVGDAWAWGMNAAASGWTVTGTPRARAVVVFPPWVLRAGGLGHVGWVTGVNWTAHTVTVLEMNGPGGWNRWDTRVVPMDSRLRYILAP